MDQPMKCSQCGLEFPASEMITYENNYVCAGCKASFVQKLKEGATLSTGVHYGGFWIRAGAILIDGIILGVTNWCISLVVFSVFPRPNMIAGTNQLDWGAGYFIALFFNIGLAIFYYIFFVGTYGATWGKMACGLKVVMADGSKVGYGRACGRYFATWLSSLILCIGYIMAAGDKEKRALHDRICNTRVIYK